MPAPRARIVHRVGWHQARAFVLPDKVIGAGTGERVLLADPPRDHAFRSAGTLSEWQDGIARYCVGNTRLTLAASLTFAPPLLDVAGEDFAGGFHLVGSSRTGKTTALYVAASVWGGGRAGGGFVRSWRHTSNALESTAQQHNDALLILDEIGMVDAREAGECAYMLAAGSGKGRAAREGGLRATPTWRMLILSSGEIGLADKMQEAKQEARAGQAARLVDLPADAGQGLGLFETLHDMPDADALARHLRAAAGRFYGVAVQHFLARLVEERQHNEAELRARMAAGREEFFRTAVPADAGGQVRSVAARFALVASGGELATEWGITGWQRGEAMGAVQKCFLAWLRERGGPGALEELRGLERVRDFIARHGNARFEVWAERAAPTSQAEAEAEGHAPPGGAAHRGAARGLAPLGSRQDRARRWRLGVLHPAQRVQGRGGHGPGRPAGGPRHGRARHDRAGACRQVSGQGAPPRAAIDVAVSADGLRAKRTRPGRRPGGRLGWWNRWNRSPSACVACSTWWQPVEQEARQGGTEKDERTHGLRRSVPPVPPPLTVAQPRQGGRSYL